MLIQNLLLIIVLLAFELALILVCNKLKFRFVKFTLMFSMILLLIFLPVYFFDRHLIVGILKRFFKCELQIYQYFKFYMIEFVSISFNVVVYLSITLVGFVLVLLVALIVETIKASYELILYICDLFKSKSKHPRLLNENIIFVEDNLSKEKCKNLYLKFCRLLN